MPRTSLIHRCHSGERGTAIFVVVMVVTLLTGIGLFAARVTGSVDRATGEARQAAQAMGLALYAAQLAPVALAVDKYPIIDQMDRSKVAGAMTPCATNRYLPNLECALRHHVDLTSLATRTGATNGILESQLPAVPGSLGSSTGDATLLGVEGNLLIEYFERGAAIPIPGSSKGSNGGNLSPPLEFAITASAQIRPMIGAANNAWCSAANASVSANVQSVRMYVTVP